MLGVADHLMPILIERKISQGIKSEAKSQEQIESSQRISMAAEKVEGSEIASGFTWLEVRKIVSSAFRYVEAEQKSSGTWLRDDLFPTSRTLFGLLVSGISISSQTLERSSGWIQRNLENPNEMPDALAMAVLAIEESNKIGAFFSSRDGIENILKKQNLDGSWNGRLAISRYSASSTAYCIQALRAFVSAHGECLRCQSAIYKGVQYLERYFRSFSEKENFSYSDIVNPIEALMLPYYEAWKIIELLEIDGFVENILSSCYEQFKVTGNTKAISGTLTLLLTQKNNLNRDCIGRLLGFLINARNRNFGWSEHRGEPSEPHQTVMITLPIRQIERIGYHYVPMGLDDEWSLRKLVLWCDSEKEHSVGAVIYRCLIDRPEILLLKRNNNTWVLPKGHIENGEEFETTLRRELAEETGIQEFHIIDKIGDFSYLFRPRQVFLGKTVTYYLVNFESQDRQLEPDLDHSEIRWFAVDEIPNIPIYYDDARQAINKARTMLDRCRFD
jgi:8-oxo-dGTP pyrophosphatase MutT (NUDIX family)